MFLAAAEAWQGRHGYQCAWGDAKLFPALRKVESPGLNAVLDVSYEAKEPFEPGVTTPGEQVQRNLARIETYTPTLLQAMRTALREMG